VLSEGKGKCRDKLVTKACTKLFFNMNTKTAKHRPSWVAVQLRCRPLYEWVPRSAGRSVLGATWCTEGWRQCTKLGEKYKEPVTHRRLATVHETWGKVQGISSLQKVGDSARNLVKSTRNQ
jgi:hypothetical protein